MIVPHSVCQLLLNNPDVVALCDQPIEVGRCKLHHVVAGVVKGHRELDEQEETCNDFG